MIKLINLLNLRNYFLHLYNPNRLLVIFHINYGVIIYKIIKPNKKNENKKDFVKLYKLQCHKKFISQEKKI